MENVLITKNNVVPELLVLKLIQSNALTDTV